MIFIVLFTIFLPSLLYAAMTPQGIRGVQEKALKARQVSLTKIQPSIDRMITYNLLWCSL
jgi:hypothetical protein